jgi:hypothetical protein
MAQFLKVKTTASNQAVSLIPVKDIIGIAGAKAAGVTTITITLASANFWTITVPDALDGEIDSVIKAFNDAITANPGGIVSTVVPPLTTAQAPLPGVGSGRQPITTQAVYSQFTGCTFA